MSARFRLPAGRSYNVRATELERDRQHTQVVCNVLLLDNTVQAFKVSVSSSLHLEASVSLQTLSGPELATELHTHAQTFTFGNGR